MINTAALTGRLVKDLELRQTGTGKSVTNFTLAVDDNYKKDVTHFIDCVAWNKTAETMANYLNKGSLIGVEGNIQTRNYEHNQGYRVYVTEVVVTNFSFLEKRSDNNQSQSNYQQNTPDPFESVSDEVNVKKGDLPF